MKGFPFVYELKVRFRDVDMMKHVNNSVYLTYMEEARTAFWEWVFRDDPESRKISYILASASVNFRAPAYYREYLNIGIGVSEIRQRSFLFAYEIRRKVGGEIVADGESVQVMFDYRENTSYAIPDGIKVVLQDRGMEVR